MVHVPPGGIPWESGSVATGQRAGDGSVVRMQAPGQEGDCSGAGVSPGQAAFGLEVPVTPSKVMEYWTFQAVMEYWTFQKISPLA